MPQTKSSRKWSIKGTARGQGNKNARNLQILHGKKKMTLHPAAVSRFLLMGTLNYSAFWTYSITYHVLARYLSWLLHGANTWGKKDKHVSVFYFSVRMSLSVTFHQQTRFENSNKREKKKERSKRKCLLRSGKVKRVEFVDRHEHRKIPSWSMRLS